MLLLARTTPKDQAEKRTLGLSVFIVDMRAALGNGLTIKPLRAMINHSTTEVFFDDLRIPADSLVGEPDRGLYYILDGMNVERILIASRGDWRRPLVYRKGHRLCQGAPRVWPRDRTEPGHSISHRPGPTPKPRRQR